MSTIEELKTHIERLEDRIRELEEKKQEPLKEITKSEFLPTYDILKVYKLLANLPIYTVARTGNPDNGEVWLSNISGTRKINARINGTTYSSTLT
jgi:pyridoxal biosynthesis lyase PdxS